MDRREMMGALGAGAAGFAMASVTPRVDAAASAGTAGLRALLAEGYDEDKGQYVLPPLAYDYDALEPSIDKQTMTLHHTRHHQAYVNGINSALARLAEARKAGEYGAVQALSKAVAFHGGGHTLHTIFWKNMAPAGKGGGGEPTGPLHLLIEKSFGSIPAMRAHFSAAAGAVEGGGWALMGYDTMSGQLLIIQGENQQKHTTWGIVPVLALDVWEHAYYLKYQNRRGDYIKAWWDVVNWSDVARRVAAVR